MNLLDTIRDFIDDFIADKIAEHRQTVIITAAAVCLFLLILFIILLITTGKRETTEYPFSKVPVSAEELLFPPEPGAASGLIFSRTPASPGNSTSWGEAELERWYVEPDETMLLELKQSNDALISNIWEMIP